MEVRTISTQELYEQNKGRKPVELIDVCTPVEFREIHAERARLSPFDLKRFMTKRNVTTGETLHVICRPGSRAKQACAKFRSAGHDNVVYVKGGTFTREQAGRLVNVGKKAISRERHVQITAGLLVLLGAILGIFVQPYFITLSAFVGAGLMFTGVTNTCGMRMLRTRMPWNQVRVEPTSAPAREGVACSPH